MLAVMRRPLLVVLVSIIAVAGCGPSRGPVGPGRLSFTMPRADGAADLPVTILDATRSVLQASDATPHVAPDGWNQNEPILAPGRRDAVLVPWLGGACDQAVEFTIQARAPGVVITPRITRMAGGCLLIGYGYVLLLEFAGAVDPSVVVVDDGIS
jgi:hypothetical protein